MGFVGLATALVLLGPAVINPRFTPADLVRTSARVILLKVSAPKDKTLAAEVAETLKGAPLPQKGLKLELSEDAEVTEEEVAAALGGKPSVAGLLVLSPADGKANDAPSGAIQIDTQWFAVSERKGKWCLDKDKQDLFAVWAGSARQLAEATRYVLAEPGARFPVRSDITWGSDAHLGKLAGKANGCLALDLGGAIGPCVIILSDSGDRLLKAGSKDERPTDITGKLKLTTASKCLAPGDFDGDGRLDLASWDGKGLRLSAQVPEAAFAARPLAVDLPECLSLDAIDHGLVAGTSKGPVLLVSDGRGFAARVVAKEVPPGLGPPGICVAADLDADGRPDIVQLHAKGMALYPGEGQGRFKTPTTVALPLPKAPCAVVYGDFDADGRLDLVVCGEDGLALIARTPDERWENATHATGELAYHGNANQPRILAAAPCDINGDGRQGVALFYPNRNPLLFFNRGFACFGLARELELSGTGSAVPDAPLDPLAAPPQPKLNGAEALQGGQATGTALDLNCDGVPDLFAVTPQGDIWALFGKGAERDALTLTVALAPRTPGPVTVTLSRDRRRVGVHIVRQGIPAAIGLPEPGPATLEWKDADAKPHKREAVVEQPSRVELASNKGG
ncbi:MAG: VCBS repeat-containing protein [Planctomycetes bacterium]|nr:VCBS repeat-containing protein [Planctomycetota bacterium]